MISFLSPFPRHVGDGAVSLSGPIIFTDFGNFKSVDKFLPHFHPHSISKHHLEPVLALIRTDWSGVEISSQLPNILGGLPTQMVIPRR